MKEKLWVVEFIESEDCKGGISYNFHSYYFHSFENAFKLAKKLAAKEEGEFMGLEPSDFHENCQTWEEVVNAYMAEGIIDLIELPEHITIHLDEFKD